MKHVFVCTLFAMLVIFSGCSQDQQTTGQKGVTDSTELRLQELSRVLDRDNRNANLFHQRAKLFYTKREFDNALKDINKAISLDDKNPDYYLTLSDIQLLMGQTDNCLASLTRASALDPQNQEARLKLAKLYLILQNYSATYRVINELLATDEYNPRAYFLRAIASLETGDTARAVGDLMKSADQDQQYFDAYIQLGELFTLRHDPLAEGYLSNALRVRPDNREALYLLGYYYQSTAQFERALQTYQRICETSPDFRNAPFNRGYIYLVYLADFPKAIEAFTAAIRVDSGYTDAFFNRGYAYELNGQPDLAYDDYKMTLKLDVNNPRAIEGLNRLDQAGYIR